MHHRPSHRVGEGDAKPQATCGLPVMACPSPAKSALAVQGKAAGREDRQKSLPSPALSGRHGTASTSAAGIIHVSSRQARQQHLRPGQHPQVGAPTRDGHPPQGLHPKCSPIPLPKHLDARPCAPTHGDVRRAVSWRHSFPLEICFVFLDEVDSCPLRKSLPLLPQKPLKNPPLHPPRRQQRPKSPAPATVAA